jgi:Fe-S cluster assembly ATP-binding protein
MLKIKNLNVKKDEKVILQNLNLELEAGKTHVIMGPNGSGKSTIAKTIAGHPDFQADASVFNYSYQNKDIELLEVEPFERSLKGIFLSFQYPVEIPGISNLTFLRSLYEAHCEYQGAPANITDQDFLQMLKPHLEILSMDEKFLYRSVNEGFSGGEKKKNEILQMLLLNPKLAILDEVDSGLDIDSLKIVSQGVNKFKNKKNTVLLITHYQRLLDYIKPDFIHVMVQGKIIKTGDASLALELEKRGYDWLKGTNTHDA